MQLSSSVQPETVFLTDADMAHKPLNTSGSGNLLVLRRRQSQKCRDLIGGEGRLSSERQRNKADQITWAQQPKSA